VAIETILGDLRQRRRFFPNGLSESFLTGQPKRKNHSAYPLDKIILGRRRGESKKLHGLHGYPESQ